MSISSFFHDISDFLSGISLDEDAQEIVDEVKATSEAIREHNESNVTGQGSTLPMPNEPLEGVDSNAK